MNTRRACHSAAVSSTYLAIERSISTKQLEETKNAGLKIVSLCNRGRRPLIQQNLECCRFLRSARSSRPVITLPHGATRSERQLYLCPILNTDTVVSHLRLNCGPLSYYSVVVLVVTRSRKFTALRRTNLNN
jgi:hypothetical protein